MKITKDIPIDPTSIADYGPATVEDVLSALLMQAVHKETATCHFFHNTIRSTCRLTHSRSDGCQQTLLKHHLCCNQDPTALKPLDCKTVVCFLRTDQEKIPTVS